MTEKTKHERGEICKNCKGRGTVIIPQNFGSKLDYCPVCKGKKIVYYSEKTSIK